MVVRLCALPCLATLQWQWRFSNQSVDRSAWSQLEGNQAAAQVQYRLDCGHAQIRVPLVICGESVKMRPVQFLLLDSPKDSGMLLCGFRQADTLVKTREARLDCIRKKETKQPSKNSLQARRPSSFFCFVSSLCYILKERTRLGFLRRREGII